MKLYDCAKVIRSKNAGPFTLTIDMIFDSEDIFNKVINSDFFNEQKIAELYNVPALQIRIHPFRSILAIKVTLPRTFASSGSAFDRDVYGCQQHFPLADLDV